MKLKSFTKIAKPVSSKTINFLKNYMKSGTGSNTVTPSNFIIEELDKFKLASSKKLYRGFYYLELEEMFNHFSKDKKRGDAFIYETEAITSWTHSFLEAKKYGGYGKYFIIISATINPEQTIADLTELIKDPYLNEILPQLDEEEVLVRPGSYNTVIEEKGVNSSIDFDHFGSLNKKQIPLQKVNRKAEDREWCSVSTKDPKKILEPYEQRKLSKGKVSKAEKRIQYFKHKGTQIKSFTKIAYKRWTSEEEDLLKKIFINGREKGIPHKTLWEDISLELGRSSSEVQRKLTRMYSKDDNLKKYKQNNWTREKIIAQIKDLYIRNEDVSKSGLPKHLAFTILKVTTDKNNRRWFNSIDSAIAEAVFEVGYPRLEDGSLDYSSPFVDMEETLNYVRLGLKKRHVWTLDEIQEILKTLHQADFPLTIPFLTNHYELYKEVLGLNRKLESFKDVIKKFILDGSITSFSEVVCQIAPEYESYYNPEKTRLKLSSEEIRVKKFLDRYKIPYAIPKLGQKLPTSLEQYPNFVPDFVIFGDDNHPVAVVEVFGSIGDRLNAGVDQIYQSKTEAKQEFWNSLNDLKFIEIHNNNGRCDLGETYLAEAFTPYILNKKSKKIDLEDIIVSSEEEIDQMINKVGAAILYKNKKYKLVTAALNFEFDQLFELPKLTSKNPAMKEILDRIFGEMISRRGPQHTNPSDGNTNDYQPYKQDPFNDHNRQIAPKEEGN